MNLSAVDIVRTDESVRTVNSGSTVDFLSIVDSVTTFE